MNKESYVTLDDFEAHILRQCEIDQVTDKCSMFGNDFIFLTDEDIEALKNNKVLYACGEYGLFLAYRKEKQNA